jgi:hypothetical protein
MEYGFFRLLYLSPADRGRCGGMGGGFAGLNNVTMKAVLFCQFEGWWPNQSS